VFVDQGVYEDLRKLLDRDPTGCPPAPEIYEILRILFTQEEASVALGLLFRPLPVSVVARRAGVEPETARALLERMAGKGIVFAKKKEGRWRYALQPAMPGLFEFPFMGGGRSEALDRLAPLWNRYMETFGKGFGSPSMPFARVIPVQEELAHDPAILTYEKIDEMIDRARVVGIGHCACRGTMQRCNAPREACMMFDDTCDFLVSRGFGRVISREEMKRNLREFDARGLVHQVNNSRDKLSFICNCCSCCCELLRARTLLKNPHVMSPSGYLPEVDPGRCTACGFCAEERCPVGALEVRGETWTLSVERCIGCGLCVTGCPASALRLRRAPAVPEPAPTLREMNFTILKEKGKLEAFLSMVSLASEFEPDPPKGSAA